MCDTNRRGPFTGDILSATEVAFDGGSGSSISVNSEPTSGKSLRQSLIGAWRLVSCEEVDVKTGEVYRPFGDTPEGLILYTPDGCMSAQLSASGRRKFESGDMYRGKPEEYVDGGVRGRTANSVTTRDTGQRMSPSEFVTRLQRASVEGRTPFARLRLLPEAEQGHPA